MKTIRIQQLKHIQDLEFTLPNPGTYLLCGTNGSGKSSVLACLLRIGWPNAFPYFFKTSTVSRQLDQHDGASVTYTSNGRSVTYYYGGKRWSPTPKSNTDVLKEFGYPSVFYVGANASRIEPRPEDFSPQRVRDAPEELRLAAEQILLSDKFRTLKRINVRRGTGAEAFLLLDKARIEANNNQRNYYYSEKSFSLGELCVLKLLRDLQTCSPNSLVLIDELELALHPIAQVNLFKFIEQLAAQKALTVIFSTHSTTLIKAAKQEQILLLTKYDSGVHCLVGAYPAQAIGTLATSLDSSPDRAIFVEDDQARYIVDSVVQKLIEDNFQNSIAPTVIVLPIGGFREVISFLERAPALLSPPTRHYALLDQDVQTETLVQLHAANDHIKLAKFQTVQQRLRYLPWTPEVGISKRIRANVVNYQNSLRTFIGDQRLDLSGIAWGDFDILAAAPLRSKSKEIVSSIAQQIAELRALDQRDAKRVLAQHFVREEFQDQATAARLRGLLLPLLR